MHDLDEVRALARGRNQLQVAGLVGKKQTASIHIEHTGADVNQGMQQVDDVVVIDESVGDCHERFRDQLFPRYLGHGMS